MPAPASSRNDAAICVIANVLRRRLVPVVIRTLDIPAEAAAPVPEGVAFVEPHPRRVRAELGGRTVLATVDVLLVHRPGRVRTGDLLEPA